MVAYAVLWNGLDNLICAEFTQGKKKCMSVKIDLIFKRFYLKVEKTKKKKVKTSLMYQNDAIWFSNKIRM